MAFSRLFVFRQILFYCDFEWDKVTFLLSYFCVTKVITTGKAGGLLNPIRAWCWQG